MRNWVLFGRKPRACGVLEILLQVLHKFSKEFPELSVSEIEQKIEYSFESVLDAYQHKTLKMHEYRPRYNYNYIRELDVARPCPPRNGYQRSC